MANPYSSRLRRSQAVTTFGPGSIVDLREESVLIAGTDLWPRKKLVEVHEPNLEKLLGVKGFRMPSVTEGFVRKGDGDLPVMIFPRWLVCSGCNRLQDYTHFTGLFHRGGPIRCPNCGKRVYPARLILACRKGHIDDFPWEWWVHRGESCDNPALKLRSQGKTATLGDLIVSCTNCDKWRSLSGATHPENFENYPCSGNQPWIKRQNDCDEKVVPLQRGASNVYFPALISSISIPPWSSSMNMALNADWDMLARTYEKRGEVGLEITIESLGLHEELGMSLNDVVKAALTRIIGDNQDDSKITERDLRFGECQALRSELDDEGGEFRNRAAEVSPILKPFLSKVMRVERLREVRALRGFTRVDAPDPSGESDVRMAHLSARPLPWRPAIEVRGEGIYLELDEKAVLSWSTRPVVAERAGRLHATYLDMCERRGWEAERRITPRLVLVHSLSHALIRQLSLDSGYSSASIRERLYVFEPDEMGEGSTGIAGVLLYTSTVDSEGSLGGLVRQGLKDRFASTFLAALNEAVWCSSDPLCIESEGQGQGAMNLAACHACLLVSETSCEEYNRLLDRATLVGTPQNPAAGFFSRLLEN